LGYLGRKGRKRGPEQFLDGVSFIEKLNGQLLDKYLCAEIVQNEQ
jgi:hypothetical protein